MAGNPRENAKDKGFWDGGTPGRNNDGQAAGRPTGFPGTRRKTKTGVRTDLEFPPQEENVSGGKV